MHTAQLILIMAWACWGVVWAQEPTKEQCFCLQDLHENWMYDCQDMVRGEAQQRETFCRKRAEEPRTKVATKGWTRVTDGADGCNPCALPPDPGLRSGPRTGGTQP
jgi:hypothetical protein